MQPTDSFTRWILNTVKAPGDRFREAYLRGRAFQRARRFEQAHAWGVRAYLLARDDFQRGIADQLAIEAKARKLAPGTEGARICGPY